MKLKNAKNSAKLQIKPTVMVQKRRRRLSLSANKNFMINNNYLPWRKLLDVTKMVDNFIKSHSLTKSAIKNSNKQRELKKNQNQKLGMAGKKPKNIAKKHKKILKKTQNSTQELNNLKKKLKKQTSVVKKNLKLNNKNLRSKVSKNNSISKNNGEYNYKSAMSKMKSLEERFKLAVLGLKRAKTLKNKISKEIMEYKTLSHQYLSVIFGQLNKDIPAMEKKKLPAQPKKNIVVLKKPIVQNLVKKPIQK